MANVLDCDYAVSEFVVLFWTNTLRKGMNLLILLLLFKKYHFCSFTGMALAWNNW